MITSYEAAVETLYRGPLDAFVGERKRLAAELKGGGDKEGAARLGRLGRPSISAWATNQLWWHEREAFERLLATAKRLKKGEHEAGAEHQRALFALRELAAARLVRSGHAAPESTLRRVTTTLSALAVAGGFDPDPPGALVADRGPPGFEAFGIDTEIPVRGAKRDEKQHAPPFLAKPGEKAHDARAEARREREAVEAKRREQAVLERKRAAEEHQHLEEERARKRAERQRLTTALIAAQAEAATHQRDADRLRHELSGAERDLEKARRAVAKLKEALAALEGDR
jgi:hypothetical protein